MLDACLGLSSRRGWMWMSSEKEPLPGGPSSCGQGEGAGFSDWDPALIHPFIDIHLLGAMSWIPRTWGQFSSFFCGLEAYDVTGDGNFGSWGGSRLQCEDAGLNSHLEKSNRSHYRNCMGAGVGEGICKTQTMRGFRNQTLVLLLLPPPSSPLF